MGKTLLAELISNSHYVYWDFDGVIKNSNMAKEEAFLDLFPEASSAIKAKIRDHHRANGGLSRFEKIPLYMTWVGQINQDPSELFRQFGANVLKNVVDSDYIAGALELLESNSESGKYQFLVTATPSSEIQIILEQLSIKSLFSKIVGAPVSKLEAVDILMKTYGAKACDSVFIGDSLHDYIAASHYGIEFVWVNNGCNPVSLASRATCEVYDLTL